MNRTPRVFAGYVLACFVARVLVAPASKLARVAGAYGAKGEAA